MSTPTYGGPTADPSTDPSVNPFGQTAGKFTKQGVPIYTGPGTGDFVAGGKQIPEAHHDPDMFGVLTPDTYSGFTDSNDVVSSLYALSHDQLVAYQQKLYDAGYLTSKGDFGVIGADTRAAMTGLLQDTYLYNQQDINVTPDEVLAQHTATAKGAKNGNALSDPLVAQHIVTNALTDHLGRKPTPAEQSQFNTLLSSYSQQGNASETGASQLAENFATGTQSRANEAGALTESRFVDVLSNLMGRG